MAYSLLWPLAILVLPWQTRLIVQSGTVGGYPWEQGTVAAYASWIVLLLAVGVGLFVTGFQRSRFGTGNSELGSKDRHVVHVPRSTFLFAAAALFVLLAVSLLTSSRTATLLWWSHAAILGLFAWTLVRSRVEASSVTLWFVLSLVPHAALGVWQFARQDVIGSTFLGIATQHPWTSGVSVIEHGLYRVLRAYGGFPHPNIFGGWLAVGLTLLPGLARRSKSNLHTLAFAACAALFSLALVLTFSRGAWLAAMLGVGIAHWAALTQNPSKQDRQAVWLVHVAILATAAAGLASQWDHVQARFTPELRLERWSLEQRKTALEFGVESWLRRPLQGWGPGASEVAVVTLCATKFSEQCAAAPEPPHAVPLVVLVETGALGFIVLLTLVVAGALSAWRSGSARAVLPVAVAATVLALTDHYLWTLWAGQALAAIVLILAFVVGSKRKHPLL